MNENTGRMTRTPDEIKKGLLCFSAEHQGCIDCAYRHFRECSDLVAADARACIQQFEAEVERLQAKLEKVKRERDALRHEVNLVGSCAVCGADGIKCRACYGASEFVWRGPCAENGGA